MINSVMSLIKNNKFSEAIAAIESLKMENVRENEFFLWYLKAFAEYSLGQYQNCYDSILKCENTCEQLSLSLSWQNNISYLKLATLFEFKNYNDLLSAIDLEKQKEERFYLLKARVFFELEKYDEMITFLKSIESLSYQGNGFLGVAHLFLGQDSKALEYFFKFYNGFINAQNHINVILEQRFLKLYIDLLIQYEKHALAWILIDTYNKFYLDEISKLELLYQKTRCSCALESEDFNQLLESFLSYKMDSGSEYKTYYDAMRAELLLLWICKILKNVSLTNEEKLDERLKDECFLNPEISSHFQIDLTMARIIRDYKKDPSNLYPEYLEKLQQHLTFIDRVQIAAYYPKWQEVLEANNLPIPKVMLNQYKLLQPIANNVVKPSSPSKKFNLKMVYH